MNICSPQLKLINSYTFVEAFMNFRLIIFFFGFIHVWCFPEETNSRPYPLKMEPEINPKRRENTKDMDISKKRLQ